MASRVSPRKATPPKQMSKQHTKGGAAGGARKPAAAAGAGGRARARAASAAESSDEDDGGMPEGVLFEVKRLCGKRIKHGELQYQVEWLGWPNKTWSAKMRRTEAAARTLAVHGGALGLQSLSTR